MPRFHREVGRAAGLVFGCLLLGCLLGPLSAASAAPPADWLEAADLSNPGRNASNPVVAMDAAGNTAAFWERQSTLDPSYNTQVSTRAVGGSFAAPADLGLHSTEPQVASSPGGETVVAWKHFANPPGVYVIEVATRTPGGTFSAPVQVYAEPQPGIIPQGLRVAIGSGGDVAVSWSEVDPDSGFDELICGEDPETGPFSCSNPSFVMGAVRPAGGGFTPAQRISEARGTEEPGETAIEKEEREIEESKRSAGSPRPVVDGAGRATVLISFFDGTENVIQSVTRDPGGEFGAPVQISESGQDAAVPEAGIDGAGNAVATWVRNDGSNQRVRVAVQPVGGGFGPPADVSAPGSDAERPVLGVASDGGATVVWRADGVGGGTVQASTRSPGGTFGAPVDVSSGKDGPLFHGVAVGDGGSAVVVWSGAEGPDEVVRAAVRPFGSGGFDAPVGISQSSPNLFHPRPAMDARGDATVVWTRDNGFNSIVQMAGYDADPPQLAGVAIPSSGTVAEPLQFSASATDVWPVEAPVFDFGDGSQAGGPTATHAYAAPGTYSVGLSATDSVGRQATGSATVVVRARNYFKLGRLKLNRHRGTATLAVTVPEPGALRLTGRGLRKAVVRTAVGRTLKLAVRPGGRGLRQLRRKGKLRVRLKLSYSPDGGETSSRRRRLTLRKTPRVARHRKHH